VETSARQHGAPGNQALKTRRLGAESPPGGPSHRRFYPKPEFHCSLEFAMRFWRYAYYLFHGLDTSVRIEFENGGFRYPEGSLPSHKRQAIEALLIEANISKALIAIKRSNQVAMYGIENPSLAQRIRNVVLT
jgi:hypothetical protein